MEKSMVDVARLSVHKDEVDFGFRDFQDVEELENGSIVLQGDFERAHSGVQREVLVQLSVDADADQGHGCHSVSLERQLRVVAAGGVLSIDRAYSLSID